MQNIQGLGPVAVLYQATPPPTIDGVRKDPKPGGYSDSGADIAYTLRDSGISVITPGGVGESAEALSWVFPDTESGLAQADALGVQVLWANTVLFDGHPIERWLGQKKIVGQHPHHQQLGDDKFATNARLRQAGLTVAPSILVASEADPAAIGQSDLNEAELQARGLIFPLVVKPVRGRGS